LRGELLLARTQRECVHACVNACFVNTIISCSKRNLCEQKMRRSGGVLEHAVLYIRTYKHKIHTYVRMNVYAYMEGVCVRMRLLYVYISRSRWAQTHEMIHWCMYVWMHTFVNVRGGCVYVSNATQVCSRLHAVRDTVCSVPTSLTLHCLHTYMLHAASRPEKAVARQLPCPLKVAEVARLLLRRVQIVAVSVWLRTLCMRRRLEPHTGGLRCCLQPSARPARRVR